jgi:DNA-binding LytR/AlgR family response regulator
VSGTGLRVLVVDDELPALDELAWLLRQEEAVGEVVAASDATEALRVLHDNDVDAVFLDVRMPGLDGLELARVLSRFAVPPGVVFVSAFDDHAVEAFELRAVDYLLKPVRPERLREALGRVGDSGRSGADQPATGVEPPSAGFAPAPVEATADDDLAVLPVELAGRTRFVRRDEVQYAEASGDYTRLHTADGSYLVRTPMAMLEARWAAAGFVRIHRSFLVAISCVSELRASTGAGTAVVVGDRVLPVSRRHARALKDRLVRSRLGRRETRG